MYLLAYVAAVLHHLKTRSLPVPGRLICRVSSCGRQGQYFGATIPCGAYGARLAHAAASILFCAAAPASPKINLTPKPLPQKHLTLDAVYWATPSREPPTRAQRNSLSIAFHHSFSIPHTSRDSANIERSLDATAARCCTYALRLTQTATCFLNSAERCPMWIRTPLMTAQDTHRASYAPYP